MLRMPWGRPGWFQSHVWATIALRNESAQCSRTPSRRTRAKIVPHTGIHCEWASSSSRQCAGVLYVQLNCNNFNLYLFKVNFSNYPYTLDVIRAKAVTQSYLFMASIIVGPQSTRFYIDCILIGDSRQEGKLCGRIAAQNEILILCFVSAEWIWILFNLT